MSDLDFDTWFDMLQELATQPWHRVSDRDASLMAWLNGKSPEDLLDDWDAANTHRKIDKAINRHSSFLKMGPERFIKNDIDMIAQDAGVSKSEVYAHISYYYLE